MTITSAVLHDYKIRRTYYPAFVQGRLFGEVRVSAGKNLGFWYTAPRYDFDRRRYDNTHHGCWLVTKDQP